MSDTFFFFFFFFFFFCRCHSLFEVMAITQPDMINIITGTTNSVLTGLGFSHYTCNFGVRVLDE